MSRSKATGNICTGPSTRKATPSISCCEPIVTRLLRAGIIEKAIAQNGEPETVTVDKSGANLAALETINTERETPIMIRQNK
ncbi:hypothetical protein PUN4_550226 [Paraburkholderia unamae]|nr:hypothetical protein C7401_119105 [Paraburkholderia unamae]CAG9268262.1 hypothetical protein PUN4_550226 [Paraburkholderia unamae]